MAWLSRNNLTPSDYLIADMLNSLANDDQHWGGDVNGGNHKLSNVILSGSGGFEYQPSPMEITPGVDGQSVVQFDQTVGPNQVPRWYAGKNVTAETGLNVGSDYIISRFTDAGAVIGVAFSIRRSDGLTTLGPQLWNGAINGNGQTISNVIVAGTVVDPTTTKGDLLARNATVVARVGVGTDGFVLTADAAQATGVKWASPVGQVTSVFTRTGAVVAGTGDYTAAQVTNAVDKTGAYPNPAWITSLPWTKITGVPATGVSSVFTRTGAVVAGTGDYTAAQVTNAVDQTGSYANPAWIASLPYSKITGAPAPGAGQTPWLTDIDAAGKALTNTSKVAITSGGTPVGHLIAGGAAEIRFESDPGVACKVAGAPLDLASDTYLTLSSGLPNTERVRITTAGLVGVGKIPATYRLEVAGDIDVTGGYRVNGVPLVTGGGGQMQTPWTSDINAATFKLKSAGGIGIGNDLSVLPLGPGASHLVAGSTADASTFGSVTVATNSAGPAIVGSFAGANYAIAGTDKRIAAINIQTDGATNSGMLQFFTWSVGAAGERMRIASAGEVSIGGPTVAGYSLVVYGPTGANEVCSFTAAAGKDSFVLIGNATQTAQIGCFGAAGDFAVGFTGIVAGAMYAFRAGAVANTLVLNAGKVGILKASPGYALDVTGDVNCTGTFRINGTPISTGGGAQTPWTSNIDGGGFSLSNVATVTATQHVGGGASLTSLTWANIVGRPPLGSQSMTDSSLATSGAWALEWRNYANHQITDVSSGISPTGTAVSSTDAAQPWTGSYPCLVGWNGSSTYGVRVDNARLADTATNATNATNAGYATNAGSATNATNCTNATNATNATTAASANALSGLVLSGVVCNVPNQVVRTDASGYINAGWINTVSGDNGTAAIARVYASNDAYLRFYTLANFKAQLGIASGPSSQLAPSRNLNTAYVNNTGKMVYVSVTIDMNPGGSFTGYSDPSNGNTIAAVATNQGNAAARISMFWMVPAGWTYKTNGSGGNIVTWVEWN